MRWESHIHSDPEVLVGKPVVRGTRLSVEFLIGLYSEGWTEHQILDNYPALTTDGLRAAMAFAAEALRDGGRFSFR